MTKDTTGGHHHISSSSTTGLEAVVEAGVLGAVSRAAPPSPTPTQATMGEGKSLLQRAGRRCLSRDRLDVYMYVCGGVAPVYKRASAAVRGAVPGMKCFAGPAACARGAGPVS